jgi:hypothetical protein
LASQRQFEGPVLEELLERVRAEVGPDARIVAANRIRKGGVGGFFAKQAFEVVVEPPASASGRGEGFAAKPQSPAPTTTTAPIAQPLRFTPPATPMPMRVAPTTASAVARAEGRAPASILELADAVSDDERNDVIDLVEERSVSTESHDFAQVLDRFSRAIDATPEELNAEPDAGSDIDLRDRDPHAATSPEQLAAAAPTADPEDDDDLVITPRVEPAPRVQRPAAAPAAEVIDRYETRLSRLGLPARLIPRGAASRELKGALVESLTRLPPAPSVPTGLGVVIAIVGESSTPVALARDLATDLGLDPDDVVLATRDPLGHGIPAWLQMNDAATAAERRRSWGRRNRPTIVACSLPPQPRGLRWARELLNDLEPTVTWAIVDAGAKREDIAHRVESLGGVDVLALDRLDDTVSPASVIELGIPIGRLAEEHASPLTWTELLLERMSS